MLCGGVKYIGTNILVEPGISIFRVRRKELLYPEEGAIGSSKPHGVTSCDFILIKLKFPLSSTCLYAVGFSFHKIHCDVPHLNLSSTENL
jgi:hypothetical protein